MGVSTGAFPSGETDAVAIKVENHDPIMPKRITGASNTLAGKVREFAAQIFQEGKGPKKI